MRIEFPQYQEGKTHLYQVFNTAHRSLFVLARDRATAQSIAWTAAHIRHTDNGLDGENRGVYELPSGPSHGPLRDYWPILQKAIAQGFQGTVHLSDGQILIGNTELSI